MVLRDASASKNIVFLTDMHHCDRGPSVGWSQHGPRCLRSGPDIIFGLLIAVGLSFFV